MSTAETEVVERAGREPWPWRRVGLLLAVFGLLAAGLGTADRAAHQREERALAGCTRAADEAVDRAWSPVVGMAQYVLPTLVQVPAGSTRDDILELVAGSAEDRSATLGPAAARCADLRLWWHHRDLRRRREACLTALSEAADRLEAVAADGRTAFERGSRRRCG